MSATTPPDTTTTEARRDALVERLFIDALGFNEIYLV